MEAAAAAAVFAPTAPLSRFESLHNTCFQLVLFAAPCPSCFLGIAIWSAFAWTFPFILAVLYQWDCAVGALRRGDASRKKAFAHAPLVKGPNILGQMVSGWFWAFTFLLVILWVVVMCVVFPPIRDYILTYQWAAISFVITFILKGQILTPKLYNKKASDGKIITSRRRRLFF